MTINWTELFSLQRALDDRIIEEHGLKDVDLIPKRVVSFLVELSEFANEARFFKFWSTDQSPRRCVACQMKGWERHEIPKWHECDDPLLEEFADAVHFAIGIGLALGQDTFVWEYRLYDDLEKHFINIANSASSIAAWWEYEDTNNAVYCWKLSLGRLLSMGEILGITDDEIVQAYKAKHAENHRRQDVGY